MRLWLVPTAIMGRRLPLPGMGLEVRSLAAPTSLGPAGLVGRRSDKKFIQIDIDLTRRLDVADFKAVGLEAVFDQSDFLDADPLLPHIRNDEAGRGRPDVANAAKREIPPLMDVAA